MKRYILTVFVYMLVGAGAVGLAGYCASWMLHSSSDRIARAQGGQLGSTNPASPPLPPQGMPPQAPAPPSADAANNGNVQQGTTAAPPAAPPQNPDQQGAMQPPPPAPLEQQSPPPTVHAQVPPAAPPEIVPLPGAPAPELALDLFKTTFDYNPQGRRDPFMPPDIDRPLQPVAFHGPIMPLQKFPLESLAITGILWDVSFPKAMVRDPGGKTYVIRKSDRIGLNNGYVAVIREGELVVVENVEIEGKKYFTTRILKLVR